jgi:putative peptidoglycan lipid II flippase
MLAGPLIATINGYGQFNAHDVQMTSYALIANALGLMGMSLVKVLAPGFFARQDTRLPVRIGIIALSTAMGFNLLVVIPASVFGFPLPHALLALASGIGAYVNAWLLYRALRRSGVYQPSSEWRRLGWQLLAANALLLVFLWWATGAWSQWMIWGGMARVWHLAACVVGGGLVYAMSLWLFGVRYRQLRAV